MEMEIIKAVENVDEYGKFGIIFLSQRSPVIKRNGRGGWTIKVAWEYQKGTIDYRITEYYRLGGTIWFSIRKWKYSWITGECRNKYFFVEGNYF